MINKRFETADELALWVQKHHEKTQTPISEIAANAILTLISITCMLLKRQIDAQAKFFQENGGFTERLYHTRKQTQQHN